MILPPPYDDAIEQTVSRIVDRLDCDRARAVGVLMLIAAGTLRHLPADEVDQAIDHAGGLLDEADDGKP